MVWGAHGSGEAGTIVGGCDSGVIEVYDATKQLKGESGLVSHPRKHTGPVHTLDFNPFQQNLLATGAGESEIFIWDMNNTNTPMSPGAKTQPPEDVLSVSWNRQVGWFHQSDQNHILQLIYFDFMSNAKQNKQSYLI